MEHRERCKKKNWVLIVVTICALVFSATCKPATLAEREQSVKRPANCLCIPWENATVPLEAQDPYPTDAIDERLGGNTKEQDNNGGLIVERISDDDPDCPPCPPGQKPQKKAVVCANDQCPVEGSSEVNGKEHNRTNPEHHGHHHHHGGWHHMPHHHGHQHYHHWPQHHGHHGPPPFNYHSYHHGGGRYHHGRHGRYHQGPPGRYHQGPPGHYHHGFNSSADPNLLLQPPGQAPPQGGHMNHHGFGGPHLPPPGPGGPPPCTDPAQEGCQFRPNRGYFRRHRHNG